MSVFAERCEILFAVRRQVFSDISGIRARHCIRKIFKLQDILTRMTYDEKNISRYLVFYAKGTRYVTLE